MDSITIILDEKEVSGRPGTTILELANEIGVKIPSLCYDSHLSPLGACRVCLVEDVTSGRMIASCVTPIAQGMVINTTSERVLTNRKNVVELILASHPDSCIVCDKGNRCELRQIATDLDVGLSAFEKIPSYSPVVELNPFIQRDLSKCIRCGRCIRADQEIAVVGAIDYTDRGFESRPATLHDVPLELTECNFCGICVSVCPTGALYRRHRASTLSASFATRTICTLCGTGCAIFVEHVGGKITGVEPADDAQSVNHISLCVKGHYGTDFVHSESRLTKPLIRRNGELEPATWEEALSLVVEKFSELRDSFGGRLIGALGAANCSNEENYLLQKLVRTAFSSNNIDSSARLRGLALATGIERVLGMGTATAPFSHIRDAEEILVIGADPLVSSPIVGQMIKQAVKLHGSHLTLVDILPRGLSVFAGCWIRPRPGTTVVLLAGLLRQIFEVDACKTRSHSPLWEWFTQLDQSLKPFSLELVEEATGVPAKLIVSTATRLGQTSKLAVVCGEAALFGEDGGLSAGTLLAALILRTGNVGRPGCGLFPIAGSLNDQGAIDMGTLPEKLPGHRDSDRPEERAEIERAWNVTLPSEKGLDYLSMIESACKGELAGLYVVGENPVLDCPGTEMAKEALSRLEFLVVQDRFLTETAELADVVLPSTSFAEKDGSWTNLERRVQLSRQVVPPVGESREDWRILAELLNRFGVEAAYESAADVLCEINDTVANYRGVTSVHLALEPVFLPCTDADDPGEPILFTQAPPSEPTHPPPDLPIPKSVLDQEHFPFSLMISESLFHSRDRAATSHSKTLRRAMEDGQVTMNPFDARLLGLSDASLIEIRSAHGVLQTSVTISQQAPRSILLLTNTPSVAPSWLLALAEKDRECSAPRLHRIAVTVEVTNEH